MAKEQRTAAELEQLVLAATRNCPECADLQEVSVSGLMDGADQPSGKEVVARIRRSFAIRRSMSPLVTSSAPGG